MTKQEREIVNLFKDGNSIDALHIKKGFPAGLDVEDIIRTALKAQDKKKGKA